jgi:hypothetical protein
VAAVGGDHDSVARLKRIFGDAELRQGEPQLATRFGPDEENLVAPIPILPLP